MAAKKVLKSKSNPKPKKKKATTPRVRGKTGLGRLTREGKILLGNKYVTATATSSIGADVAKQAAAVKTSCDSVGTLDKEHRDLLTKAGLKYGELIVEEGVLDIHLGTFVHDGALAAKGDAALLKSLAIEEALKPGAQQQGPPAKPGTPLVEPHAVGSSLVTFIKPPGAASMLIEYRLDGVTPEVWIQAGGTSRSSFVLDSLPPGVQIRVRIRPIGDGWGEWSEEGLGRVG